MMSITARRFIVLLAPVCIAEDAAYAPKPFLSSNHAKNAVDAKIPVKIHEPNMHDRDEALRSTMRSMMSDDDADDDVWYGMKPKNGLIQTGDSAGMSLDDEYM